MLCHLCETFVTDILNDDLTTWRRIKEVEEKWFTFKLGNHATVQAAASAGCEICALFNQVRNEIIPNYTDLGEKWHTQPASIDVKHRFDSNESGLRWTFQLLTVAPEMSWIAFEIYKPDINDNENDHSDYDVSNWPQEVVESPTSCITINIAKQWIQNCLTEHPKCTRPDLTPLPTRVIDVGHLNDRSNPRLYVSQGQLDRYVTLSHVWGVGYRVVLTRNNLPKFEQEIVLNKLPKTFQDAIQMTRLLGVRYLWIDALCIIQDDSNDWKRESTSMCSVFENAVFSISAVAATDTHSGTLHSRTPYQVKVEINGTQVGVRQKLDTLSEAMTRSRLETRAWCYQERLLPKGILHIAPAQMYWECATFTASETFPTGQMSISSANTTQENVAEQAPLSVTPTNFSKDWLRLTSIYSARQVTRASDRLPAIAGLADKVKKELAESVYLQGVWSHDLHAGLLWKRQLIAYGRLIPSRDRYVARSSTSSGERPRKPIARSWSWASTNDAVEFPTAGLYQERSVTKSDAKFLIPDHGEDDEFELQGMFLPLEALIKRGTCRFSAQTSSKPDEASFKPSGSLLVDDGLKCFLDYVDDVVSKTCYCVRIANWKQPSKKPKRKGDDDSEQAFYLLLERMQQKSADIASDEDSFGTFRRIGIGWDLPRKVDKIFANAERRLLRLV